MNRRFLTSAVTIHAGACFIAIASVGAGAPIANGLMDSAVDFSSSTLPVVEALSVNDNRLPLPTESKLAQERVLSETLIEPMQVSAESVVFDPSIEPEVIMESSLLSLESNNLLQVEGSKSTSAGEHPLARRSAGR